MNIAVVTSHEPFLSGGAEYLAEELVMCLRSAGHFVDLLALPWSAASAESIIDSMLVLRNLDLSAADRVIALKFPAYLIPHPSKVVWLLHQFRGVYDLWDHPTEGYARWPSGPVLRSMVRHSDRKALVEARRIMSISPRVSKRLWDSTGIRAPALVPPPPLANDLSSGQDEGFFFFPSRITPLKRHDLVLRALALCVQEVQLRIVAPSANADYEREVRALAAELGVENRVKWLGKVSKSTLVELYRSCRAVVFPPVDEDLGFVTLEAMAAAKAVLTCEDSGGTRSLVKDGVTGRVAAAEPRAIAVALDELWRDPARTRKLGERASQSYQDLGLSWRRIVRELTK